MYDGTGIAEVSTREVEIGAHGSDTIEMAGWFVCNGLVSTPNLLDRFVRGFSESGGLGGSNDAVVVEHTHDASQVEHTHGLSGGGELGDYDAMLIDKRTYVKYSNTGFISPEQPVITVDNAGVSGVGLNAPKYYKVIMIIRMS